MRKPSLRFLLRHRRTKRVGEKGQLLLSVLLGVSLAFLLIRCFDLSLRPQMIALAETSLQNQITHISDLAMAKVVEERSLGYSDMVVLQTGQDGGVSMLTTNTLQLNALRSALLEEVVSQVEGIDNHSLGIPFGTLTGIDLFSAWGPKLPVQVISVASADGTYRNDFTSAGINQTLHRILLDVTVTARILLPGGIVETEIAIPVCVAETVIIGQVPQTFLQIPAAQ